MSQEPLPKIIIISLLSINKNQKMMPSIGLIFHKLHRVHLTLIQGHHLLKIKVKLTNNIFFIKINLIIQIK